MNYEPRSRFELLITTFLAWLTCFVPLRIGLAEAKGTTVDEILKAWEERKSQITSFEYHGVLTTVHDYRKAIDPHSPLRELVIDPTQDEVTLVRKFVVAMDGKKFMHSEIGDVWHDDLGEKGAGRTVASFDGQEYISLIDHAKSPLAMGDFRRCKELKNRMPGEVNRLAILFWYDPAGTLALWGWSLKNLQLANEGKVVASSSAEQCVELRSLRGGGRQILRLLIQDSAPNLPVRVVFESDQQQRSVLQIAYSGKGELQKVASWVRTQYGDNLIVESVTEGQVERCTVNRPVEDAAFSVEIRPGTHLMEETKTGNRYWIQGSDGNRKPITEEEFGDVKEEAL